MSAKWGLLLAAALLLTGCIQADPPPPDEAPQASESAASHADDSDPLLLELSALTELVDFNTASVYSSSLSTQEQAVQVSDDLLRGAVEVILAGSPERLAGQGQSTSGSGINMILMQFMTTDGVYVCVQLVSNTDALPDRVLLWLQVGETSAEYALGPAVFDAVEALITARTHDKKLVLEGEYTRYSPISLSGNSWFGDMLETDGKLLFLWNDGYRYSVEAVDPTTGTVEVLWSDTAANRLPGRFFKLESAAHGGFDFRVYGHGMVVYGSSGAPDLVQVFTAPEDALESRRLSFDWDPQEGLTAYSDDEGVYVAGDSGSRLVLDNSNLPVGGAPSEEFFPYYGEVHWMNGGKQLVASHLRPGSQSGIHGIVVVDMEGGAVTVFEDLFSAMVADVRYLDDKTIAAVAMDRVTLIDVETKQTRELPYDHEKTTYDFETTVTLLRERDGTGAVSGALVLEGPDGTRQLLAANGENVQLGGMTEHYAALLCQDIHGQYVAVAPLGIG